ncbi:hypothetical protein JAAARDRAFT_122407 [Jaapia argillacea MUCL 33604]|uniref:Major facilitator superfamily (MFS) profile domain-containing protein n=1 Tax=Jaapia argillacea MUCL 33604 TaxID=933084 RepID=A0A067Q940_9AGAM|nr:hypothetical protein JAAARDRAFT_122407 [Jaapia argillacea MUCL 33604]
MHQYPPPPPDPRLKPRYQHPQQNRPRRIVLLDERRRALLQALDEQEEPTRFHKKVAWVAAAGFFTDAYDIFAINIAAVMIGDVYGSCLSASQDLGLKIASPVGNFFGQLFFGWLADQIGRKKMYGVELLIIITATFCQAIAAGGHAINLIGVLIFWRIIMGVGIGGDYPLSAIIVSEFSGTTFRGRLMTAVFAAQGLGNLFATIVSVIVLSAYRHAIETRDSIPHLDHIDYLWRLVIGMGCIPCVFALWFRFTIPETTRFTLDIKRNIQRAEQDVAIHLSLDRFRYDPSELPIKLDVPQASWEDFKNYFGDPQHSNRVVTLICAAWSWLSFDIAFYGMGLNTYYILSALHYYGPKAPSIPSIPNTPISICVHNLIFAFGGLLPGYLAAWYCVDKPWGGRWRIQMLGFTALTLLLVIMSTSFEKLSATKSTQNVFIALYCFANFFQNFGPNVTTFIMPGEMFPTRYRSTVHGICAAAGKLGAIVSQVSFLKLMDKGGTGKFVKDLLGIFAVFTFTGLVATYFLEETRDRSLEDLSFEEQVGFVTGATPQRPATFQRLIVIHYRTSSPRTKRGK